MTAHSWRRAKRACKISVRSCHLKPFHMKCVSSKCCSTNWAVNMELWTLASECSRSLGVHQRALPPSLAARVYTSPLVLQQWGSGVQHRENSLFCCAIRTQQNPQKQFERLKKKCSLEAGKFLSGLNFTLARGVLVLALLLLRHRWVHMECLQLGWEGKKCHKACTSAANARSDLACII